jgi:16S rRNA (guanine527-N7)-methyltransferase
MGSPLPPLTADRFRRELLDALPELPSHLPAARLDHLVPTLHRHYEELRRWNPRLSLVGPGTAAEIVSRHYGESLAAVPLIGPDDRTLVDFGSGAGFPGLVLAAARPEVATTLVEAREKKCTFLRTVARICGLSCRCLGARVERSFPPGLPPRIDLVTCRAVAVSKGLLQLFRDHTPGVRFLLWRGRDAPELPHGLRIRREIPLAGSHSRRILEVGS